jgi:hypothetical protein
MGLLVGAEDLDRLVTAIGLEHLLDVEHGQQAALVALESEPVARRRTVGRQGDRDGPGQAAGEVHVLDRGLVVRLVHEPGQRRQRTGRDHVEVGGLLLGQPHAGEAGGLLGEGRRLVAGDRAVDQRPAVRVDQGLLLARRRLS